MHPRFAVRKRTWTQGNYMKVVLKKGLKADLNTLVVLATKKSGKPVFGKLPADVQKWAERAESEGSFSGDKKESIFFRHAEVPGFTNLLFVGVGEASRESLRVAGSVVLGALKNHKVTSAGVFGDGFTKLIKGPGLAMQSLAEGILLSSYEFNEHKTKGKKAPDKKDAPKKPALEEIQILSAGAPNAADVKALKKAEILTECQNFVRYLGDQPGNYMTATMLADETIKAAKGTGLKVQAWDKARIKKERMGGLIAVNQGSTEEPRFIVMEYNGGGKGKKPIVYVGKGLTFDTGGISLKPGQSMEEMKYDMCGGAAVIGTMLAIAKLKLKVNAVGLVPSTDNMPGPDAFKPGDIYYARNGKSVEVFNTDAEGRLILGEALAYGSELKPQLMVDAATLTGAILIALGNTHTGVFTRDKKLMGKIQDAADESGELVWSMPLTDFHVEDMKGTAADICNISGGRNAGSSTAAAFLEEFVEKGIPWAHFDIAGTAWNVASRFPYNPKKGASGIMVRTFVELAENS
jgi:leucyl aminopeptidase